MATLKPKCFTVKREKMRDGKTFSVYFVLFWWKPDFFSIPTNRHFQNKNWLAFASRT